MPSFSVGYPDKDRIEVNFIATPDEASSTVAEWIRGEVKFQVGAFSGQLEINLCLSDVIRFKEQLDPVYETLEGIAEFKTLEDQLVIRIEIDRLGHVQASGHIVDDFTSGNKLFFNIRYDQTLLWHTISEIDEALFELRPGVV